MHEFVNIISKEEITKNAEWPSALAGLITVIAILTTFIVCERIKNKYGIEIEDILIKIVCGIVIVGIVSVLVLEFDCSLHKIPTGRYKYSATFDDTATYEDINEFLNDYTNVYIEEGVYYFEDISNN